MKGQGLGQLTLLHVEAVERLCLLVRADEGHYADAWVLTALCDAARQHLRTTRPTPRRKRGQNGN
jgi:hypothetical protein